MKNTKYSNFFYSSTRYGMFVTLWSQVILKNFYSNFGLKKPDCLTRRQSSFNQEKKKIFLAFSR